ncbi:30S ribosomal protein S2 [endosymbiont GvMRE of Glomus versiforme]|uniref:30S ribosomal protein S2 n=1 Tax=endosymbiont GvMRE of Glomus versiforme TaxID=2039283 RepID=UPI000ED5EB46|nr:30S ribosomal protein S2 [endosymbiont GvMRE of Glomus versiforme]RHZ35273.1 30S ribosomal protein S2 [endosymbiont GvMRE of Glomus versiforme]
MTNFNWKKMDEAGVKHGSLTRYLNPRMLSYIYGKNIRNKTHIFDLNKIFDSCQKLSDHVNCLIKKKGEELTILFLATKKQAQEITKKHAIRCGMPYIANKWKGGFLTNFEEIKKKLKKLWWLNNFIESPDFENLAKKEQLNYKKNKAKLQSVYEGVIKLKEKPDVVFILGLSKEKVALKECKKMGIPVIAICNSNCNPKPFEHIYVIPGNDENTGSIDFFAELMADTIIESNKLNKEEEKKINA